MRSIHPFSQYPVASGLYRPDHEHDSCGVGFVASIHGHKSHDILQKALNCLCNLIHRGAVDADAKSGDGAGVLTQIPHKFFRQEIEKMGQCLFRDEDLAVGMMFFPRENTYHQAYIRNVTEEVVKSSGLTVLGWRPVPCNARVTGDKAAFTAPAIEQILIARPDTNKLDAEAYERVLYLARNTIERRVKEHRITNFYIASFSNRTIVYKGMFTGPQLQRFYLDLQDPLFETALAMYHQRYSTNTFPTWALAQPFRMLAHNGEINTVRGNRIWVKAREGDLESSYWGININNLKPVIQPGGSDSASLDNALELIAESGRGALHALTMLVPPAFRSEENIDPAVRAFYEFHELISEPWDGPAALAVSDGRFIAAALDRNGLRPSRYKITKDGLVYLSSEMGVGSVPERDIVEKGRLGPGEMIAVDTVGKKLLRNNEIKQLLAQKQPYAEWVADNIYTLTTNPHTSSGRNLPENELQAEALRFGFNDEEYNVILKPMLLTGQEPVGSMGDDTPLAVLSERPRPLYHYFRQLFAQVTNPPIDPIRESLVMDIHAFLGRKANGLDETPEHAKNIRLDTPVLTNDELEEIRQHKDPAYKTVTLSALFPANNNRQSFVDAVENLCLRAEEAVESDYRILIISDRNSNQEFAGIPMLLAISAIHHHLIRQDLRMRVSLVAETAEVRDVHQFACLVAYGATAINPYLVWDLIPTMQARGEFGELSNEKLVANYKNAIEKGLFKIMSKMGISKLSSYHGGQLFEAIGLHESVIDRFFTGTTSFISGIRLEDIGAETVRRHQAGIADAANNKLPQFGYYAFKRDGERHAVTPPVLQTLHAFVGLKGADKANRYEDYKAFAKALEANKPIALRDLLRFQPKKAIPLEEVESVEEIRQRFTTAGMSFGAISPEAHETLAIAMNRIGGKSNSGEGGEDRNRFSPLENGDSKNSRIKQVASGRFGVTAEYLASAAEIEIKIAQGAKPGEGGQLPSHKVSSIIAKLRYSRPGMVLISPPPHHDIYSIEDLAQLIYDLKQVNPRAKICVKLVSEAGVGTIAAGVAKAHADIVLVSGHDGGTGASPLSSIKFAGSPWELGVAETQQVLLLNDLRNRITLRTDGGMRTGRDIVIAAILGAEEFNFGTAALIALGCVYVRKCHLNTCPVGVATQDERLRGKFKGTAEGLVNYLNAIAQDTREILASLGVRRLNDVIGRTEYLEQISLPDHPKANTLNLKPLLSVPDVDNWKPRYHTWERNDKLEDQPLDDRILQDVKSTLQTKRKITLTYKVTNAYRSIGAQLSGEIAYRYGDAGLPEDTINLQLNGSSGQSIGVFLVNGIRIVLKGEANDYVGEGMNGGTIVLLPATEATFDPSLNVICGNTCLYGATGGQLFVYGRAGERFGVRNSGAVSVVEGIGDHGCEYMTAGTICVLGPVGKNFGAGMSGGLAYVLDEENNFESLYNHGMVGAERLSADDDGPLKALITQHAQATHSKKAAHILDQWGQYRNQFWKVVPHPAPHITPITMQIEEKGSPAKG